MSGANGSAANALEVENLGVFYRRSQVVFDATLTVARGETVAILGRNGAGKTSLLRAIAGVVQARAEVIRLGGDEISRLPPYKRVRKGLALVPSGSRAFPTLTVRENLRVSRWQERTAAKWTLADVFETFPVLERLRDAPARTLSGGERQMLAFARAMLSAPQVVMLDEPSEGLAPMVLRQIGQRVRDMNREGIGVLVAEQNYRLALALADHVLFLEKGHVVWTGGPDDAEEPEVLHRYLAV